MNKTFNKMQCPLILLVGEIFDMETEIRGNANIIKPCCQFEIAIKLR